MESKPDKVERSYDIVIIGYGPVGQFCSAILDKYKLNIAVIETYPNIYPFPRAIAMDDEIQRLMNSLGLWEKFKEKTIVPEFVDFVFPNGKVVQRGPVAVTSNGYPFVTMFYQPELEDLLRSYVNEKENIDVFLEHELINFKEETGVINLSIKNNKENKLLKFKTKYLLACDGSKSFVRNKLNIGTVDLKYSKEWLVVDVNLLDSNETEKVARQICDPVRPTTYTLSPGNRHRWEFQLLAGERANKMLKEETISRLISPWLEKNRYELDRVAVYNFRGVHAEELRHKNIFLLGDAAHQMPPFAGQGMNSGIRDASNLCWKLAMVLKNGCGDEILDSYQSERIDQIQGTIKSSIALGKLLDSLSLAYKRNTPLEEAVAPEAREQAYGGKKSFADRSIKKGIFSSFKKDMNAGKSIQKAKFKNRSNELFIDDLIDFHFSLIVNGDPSNLLNEKTLNAFKEIDTVFVNTNDYRIQNTRFQDIMETGSIIVRPDKSIYGTTSDNVSLQELSDNLFSALCYDKS